MEQAIYQELIFMDVDADCAESVIRTLGAAFEAHGFVKDSYVEAVFAREGEYPTGLQLQGIGVAMPHTTGSHVIKPAVGVAKLKQPVTFYHMGMDDVPVQAEIVFMMAILDPEKQIDLLKKMTKIFTNNEAMQAFKTAKDKDALLAVAQTYIENNDAETL